MSEVKRKKKSRWADEKVVIPGMPTVLPDNLTSEQERLYLLQLQIEELSCRLRNNDFQIPAEHERSPSPEPIYNMDGKRLNTREYRARKKIEDERHVLIQKMLNEYPLYIPPLDYKPPQIKVTEKVLIPQEDFPDINFIGLLIGPRGNTLKSMEKESGAKIIIRGKGSVKEGKSSRKDGQPMMGEDEPLHALVTGTTQDQVDKAVGRIKEIVRQGVEVPEDQNDLRRTQLRELAMLNGTLRDTSTLKTWQNSTHNITNSLICCNCGGAGHLARDCRERHSAYRRGSRSRSRSRSNSKDRDSPRRKQPEDVDEEYLNLMSELGEMPPQNQ